MPERVSSWAVYEIFNTADGQQVFIGITSDSQWKRFCEIFGQQELAADPRLATNNLRIEARPWLVPKVAEVFKRHDRAALEQLCLDADISFAPVARPQELFDHPHLLANGSLAPTTLPGGVQTRLPLLPFQMMGWRPPLVSDPPEIGQHNDEVLAVLGYDAAGIGKLKTAGMLGAGIAAGCRRRCCAICGHACRPSDCQCWITCGGRVPMVSRHEGRAFMRRYQPARRRGRHRRSTPAGPSAPAAPHRAALPDRRG